MWRRGPDGPEVLLIHRPRRDDWSLAKGKRDPGEQLPQTAVREVAEETGIRPVLGRRLRTVRYLAGGRPKVVHYWAAAEPGAGPGLPAFIPNHEVDGIEWLTLPRASERLSYPDDVTVLEDFAQWPHRTVPLVVLRHASAGRKQDWDGDDLLRPLDAPGARRTRWPWCRCSPASSRSAWSAHPRCAAPRRSRRTRRTSARRSRLSTRSWYRAASAIHHTERDVVIRRSALARLLAAWRARPSSARTGRTSPNCSRWRVTTSGPSRRPTPSGQGRLLGAPGR